MSDPRFPMALKCLHRCFLQALLMILVCWSIGATAPGPAAASQALLAGCTQPGIRCIYLPLVSQMLDPRSRADSLAIYQSMYLASKNPSLSWTGGDVDACQAGDIGQAYREAVRVRVNYFRLMAGVPLISFRNDFNLPAQAVAMVMSANNTINYAPPASWNCYASLPVNDLNQSIMRMGVNGPDAVEDYVRDNYQYNGYYSVGYRRFILYPQTQEMGDGDVPSTGANMPAVNVLRIGYEPYYDPRPATRDAYVTWPPAGVYVPYQVVYPLWSFSYPGANFSQASVNVTVGGSLVRVTSYPPYNPEYGYGENTLVWKTGAWDSWPKPSADTSCQVTIQNVIINGQKRSFSYTLTIFDPAIPAGNRPSRLGSAADLPPPPAAPPDLRVP